ncbi:hypothetical protein J1C67_12640 [Clostridium gasigenes]|uniref:hypothetical protein n=1 Tax=Clostridium gasigenes TaxID=94869 RepID=UPI001438327C|nr:hypothetical protein [Clostridium gasigenes]NKF08608.1 hypothetical protein [Clostridium gasigenes]QSW18396.1 hypothetical protein J1C67_12640 [Clostridium gasigenes]
MKSTEILSILEKNGLSEIEELKNEEDHILVKFYFDFDNVVLNAAKAYSNEESDYEFESKEWFSEYFIPYLYDYANDEVLEIVEEIVEEIDIEGELMAFQIDNKNSNFVQFMALFTERENTLTIEEAVKDFI